mmetsp:Transcript_155721/g.275098  ORF Transcript_155721/g.275098 Transcript_155721/m.275098 type:complete len:246 (-) Transcript_155721:208-945(-)
MPKEVVLEQVQPLSESGTQEAGQAPRPILGMSAWSLHQCSYEAGVEEHFILMPHSEIAVFEVIPESPKLRSSFFQQKDLVDRSSRTSCELMQCLLHDRSAQRTCNCRLAFVVLHCHVHGELKHWMASDCTEKSLKDAGFCTFYRDKTGTCWHGGRKIGNRLQIVIKVVAPVKVQLGQSTEIGFVSALLLALKHVSELLGMCLLNQFCTLVIVSKLNLTHPWKELDGAPHVPRQLAVNITQIVFCQ